MYIRDKRVQDGLVNNMLEISLKIRFGFYTIERRNFINIASCEIRAYYANV